MTLMQKMAGFLTRRKEWNGQIEEVERSGYEDGERLARSYVDGFVAGASAAIDSAQNGFLGIEHDDHEPRVEYHDDGEVTDAEYTPMPLSRTDVHRMNGEAVKSALRDRNLPDGGTVKDCKQRLLESV